MAATPRDPTAKQLCDAICVLLNDAVADDIMEHDASSAGGGGFSLRAIHPRGVEVNKLIPLSVRNVRFYSSSFKEEEGGERQRQLPGVIIRVFDDNHVDMSLSSTPAAAVTAATPYFRSPHRMAVPTTPACCVMPWGMTALREIPGLDPHVDFSLDANQHVELTLRLRATAAAATTAENNGFWLQHLRKVLVALNTMKTSLDISMVLLLQQDSLVLWIVGKCTDARHHHRHHGLN